MTSKPYPIVGVDPTMTTTTSFQSAATHQMQLFVIVVILGALFPCKLEAWAPRVPLSRLPTQPKLCSQQQRRPHPWFPLRSATIEQPTTLVSAPKDDNDNSKVDAVVCGGGPAGLLSAIMLAQKFPNWKVQVYERLAPPPSPTDDATWSDVAKFYLIGLGSRGQKALETFGVLQDVLDVSTAVVGRKDWAPDSSEGVERIFTDRPVTTVVLPRDKLVGVLHQHILNKYATQIELNYGCEVHPVEFNKKDNDGNVAVIVDVAKCKPTEESNRLNPSSVVRSGTTIDDSALCDVNDMTRISTNLLIAADGTARTIANRMEEDDKQKRRSMNPIQRLLAGKPFSVVRYIDDNQRIYKTVPFKLPKGWRPDLNYSARSKGSRVVFDALPANRNGEYCGVLLLKKDDPMAQANSAPKELRQVFQDFLPQFGELLDDETISVVATKPPSFLPSFRYAGPRLHQGDRTLILGDSAHTVKPYFGLGANSALEDVRILGNMIDSTDDLSQAVHAFSKERAGEAKALVRLSRELDRPGALGFVTFILPIILDAIFNGLAPKFFRPNIIAMLQQEGVTFQQVMRIKRNDRIAQVTILGACLYAAVTGVKISLQLLTNLLGQRNSKTLGGLAVAAVGLVVLQKFAKFLVPGLAPADVLARVRGKVTNRDTFITPLGFRQKADEEQEA